MWQNGDSTLIPWCRYVIYPYYSLFNLLYTVLPVCLFILTKYALTQWYESSPEGHFVSRWRIKEKIKNFRSVNSRSNGIVRNFHWQWKGKENWWKWLSEYNSQTLWTCPPLFSFPLTWLLSGFDRPFHGFISVSNWFHSYGVCMWINPPVLMNQQI